MEEKEQKINSYSPRTAILLFLLIVLVLSFYESKRVIVWETPRESDARASIFRSLILSYAYFSESLKSKLGLNNFFEKENNFWLRFKKSPLIFQEVPITTQNEGKNNKNQNNQSVKEIKPEPPFKVLIMGDSFIAVWGGMGEILEQELIKYKDVTAKREGEVSSGLSRPDYFDWPSKTKELISEQDPNIIVIMLGSNDAQSLTINSDGKIIALSYGKEEWDREYENRVSDFLKIFEENQITVFWIGLPIMESPTFSEKMKHLNSIYEKEIKNYKNAYFVPTWDLFVDENGKYTDYLADEKGRYVLARLQDGIHFSYFGGGLAVKEVIKKMGEQMKLELK